jgi:outer membrane receptor protein involved in Fe transport
MDIGEGVNPIQMAFYLQDKMELKGMVVNLGARVDYFNTNSEEAYHIGMYSSPMWDRFTRAKNMPTRKADPHIYFSPRLGISHPITERAVMHFGTGVYLQWPDLFYYYGKDYRSYGRGTDRDLNGDGVIDPAEKWNNMYPTYSAHFGDPTIRPEKSTNFEVGVDYNFYGDYVAGLVAYYKSETDQYTHYPNQRWNGLKRDATCKYQRGLANGAWGDTRGIEVSLRKRFSNYFGFNASYNMQWSHTTSGALGNVVRRVHPDSMFVASAANVDPVANPDWYKGGMYWYYAFDVDPATGAEIPIVPNQADIEEWGHKNQEWLRNYKKNSEGNPIGTGYWEPLELLADEAGDAGLWNVIFGYSGDVHAPKGGDQRHIGSLSLTFASPEQWDLGPKWFGWLLSDLHGNLVYTLQTGNVHWYQPPRGARVLRDGPMRTNTDLSVEKRFIAGRLQPAVFVEISNLFNQEDVKSNYNGTRYTLYGLEVPEPTDETYQQYGDVDDWRRYAGRPREVDIGVRLTF